MNKSRSLSISLSQLSVGRRHAEGPSHLDRQQVGRHLAEFLLEAAHVDGAARAQLRDFVTGLLPRRPEDPVPQESALGRLTKAFQILDPLRGLIDDQDIHQQRIVSVMSELAGVWPATE